MRTTREFLNPDGLAKPVPGLTQVVTVQGGKLVVIAGQIALNAQSELVGRDNLRAQTVQVFENLKIALAAAGASFADVIKVTAYIANYTLADREVFWQVRAQYLSMENPPASTLIGVQALAQPEFLIEIELLAVVE